MSGRSAGPRGVQRVSVSHLHVGLAALALLLGGGSGPPPVHQEAISSPNVAAPDNGFVAAQTLDWRKATREDILAAYEIFRHHHPGMFDPHNPRFPDKLRLARDKALAFAAKVNDDEGHMRALALFSSVLADGHARVQAAYNGHGDPLWPGFRTVWRGNALRVIGSVEAGPPPGSALVGCDGKDARTVIIEGAFWFDARPAEAGQWWEWAPFTFRRSKSRYEKLPQQCRFRKADGQVANYQLRWRTLSEEMLRSWIDEGSKRDPIGLTEPRPGIYRISLPTFSPDAKGRLSYDRLFQDIDQNIANIAAGRAVVIDLRQNNGGSSSWGERVAYSLWGKAAVKAKLARYFRNTQEWWLADSANFEHFRQTAAEFRQQGRTDDAAELDDVVRHLAAAQDQGKRFYIEDYGASLEKGQGNPEPRQLPPVYVITDGECASACLDAVDVFTRFAGVKLVGAPTSADSTYLDIRFQPLPSNRGVVILPTKIWVRRPRGAGEVYLPDIPVNDVAWTTPTMLDHIERDLANR